MPPLRSASARPSAVSSRTMSGRPTFTRTHGVGVIARRPVPRPAPAGPSGWPAASPPRSPARRSRRIPQVPPVAQRHPGASLHRGPAIGGLHRERTLRRAHHQPLLRHVLDDLVDVGHPPAQEPRHERHPRPDLDRRRGLPFHRRMFAYHCGAFVGSAAYPATSAAGSGITASVRTSTSAMLGILPPPSDPSTYPDRPAPFRTRAVTRTQSKAAGTVPPESGAGCGWTSAGPCRGARRRRCHRGPPADHCGRRRRCGSAGDRGADGAGRADLRRCGVLDLPRRADLARPGRLPQDQGPRPPLRCCAICSRDSRERAEAPRDAAPPVDLGSAHASWAASTRSPLFICCAFHNA